MADVDIDSGIRIGVYGATGALGREVLQALEGHGLPIDSLVAVGGVASAGKEAYWRGSPITVLGEQHVEIDDLDVAILAVPPSAAEALRGPLIDAGVFVVDLAASGGQGALPLMWPSLNADALETHPGGVALPCGIAGALAPLMTTLGREGAIVDLDVTALMSAQAVGRQGAQALSSQTVALLNQRLPSAGPFGGVLAFNLLPGSPRAGVDGDPIATQARDQLARLVPTMADVRTSIRVVQVPVFAGLGLAVRVQFDGDGPGAEAVEASLESAGELRPIPDEGRLALRDTMEQDAVFLAELAHQPGGIFRVFVATDPLHRSAWAIGAVLERVLAEDLW
jgi:aspartate-semialdehyde dehydrogenase